MDQNVALIERLYRAFAVSDTATLAQTFAADVEMIQVGSNALAGQFRGRDALFGHFADIPRFTEALTMVPEAILADADGHVAALNRMTVRKAGVEGEFHVIHLFRIRNGQVVELRSIPEDPYALDTFIGPRTQEPAHAAP
jgi:ketosteroid isomerase-like protein